MDHGDIDPGLTTLRVRLIVLAQPPVPAQPGERPLDDPPLGQDDEPLRVVAPLASIKIGKSDRVCRV